MRILVVDDHEIVRRGVISLLLSRSEYVVCGEAVNGQDAVEKAVTLRPNVILMDLNMPTLNGLEAIHTLHRLLPSTEILAFSQHDSPEMVRQAFKAGARGYLMKSSMGQNLFQALDKVSRHECFFDPAFAQSSVPLDLQELLERSAVLEQALRESEQLYRTTFELAAVGVAHVNPEGRWLRVNQKLCDIVG